MLQGKRFEETDTKCPSCEQGILVLDKLRDSYYCFKCHYETKKIEGEEE